jgi:hypothetical protein
VHDFQPYRQAAIHSIVRRCCCMCRDVVHVSGDGQACPLLQQLESLSSLRDVCACHFSSAGLRVRGNDPQPESSGVTYDLVRGLNAPACMLSDLATWQHSCLLVSFVGLVSLLVFCLPGAAKQSLKSYRLVHATDLSMQPVPVPDRDVCERCW